MSSENQKSKPTHFYSSVSIAIVLFLLGLFSILTLHAQDLTDILKERIGIIAELETSSIDYKNIIAEIQQVPGVKPNSLEYIPKSTGLQQINEGLSIKIKPEENPLKDIIRFNISAEHYSEKTLLTAVKAVSNIKGVDQVFHEDASIDAIRSNLSRLATVILVIGLIFVFLAIVIIRNTINLRMYADRHEIKTMQLIGAKWNFIKIPYIKSAINIGLNAFFFAFIMILIVMFFVQFYLTEVWNILSIYHLILSFIVVLGFAIIIPALVANGATNKYLSHTVE